MASTHLSSRVLCEADSRARLSLISEGHSSADRAVGRGISNRLLHAGRCSADSRWGISLLDIVLLA